MWHASAFEFFSDWILSNEIYQGLLLIRAFVSWALRPLGFMSTDDFGYFLGDGLTGRLNLLHLRTCVDSFAD